MTRGVVGLILGAIGLYAVINVSIILGAILMVVGVVIARWGDIESPFRPR